MKRSRLLIAMGYGLAALLLVLPVLEPLVTLLPPQPGQVRWRLQAFGALSQSLVLPLLGIGVGATTAVLLGHRRVLRVLGASAVLAGCALAVATVLFALDLVQYRASIEPALHRYYQVAGINYFTAFVLGSAFLVAFGIVAWRAAAASRRKSRRSRKTLVHNPGAPGPLS
jgi:hypothetical protein